MSDHIRFARLVKSFHALSWAPVFDKHGECDLKRLDAWAHAQDPTGDDGVAMAAAFCLNLWSRTGHGVTWLVGSFDLFEALSQWDERHLAAWQAWAAAPWRP